MFCTSCKADLGIRLPKFCTQCGAPLQVASTPAKSVSTDDDSTILISTSGVPKAPPRHTEPAGSDDNDSTILISAHKTPKVSQKPIPALLSALPPQPDALTAASTLPTMIFSGISKDAGLLQKPVSTPPPRPDALTAASSAPTMIFSGAKNKARLLQEPVLSPPPQPDALTAASTLQTMILSGINREAGLLQKPVSTPPPQPDALTAASTLPTMIFSGRGAGLIEPYIPSSPSTSTVQNEPAPSLAPPERDDRIVVEPPYPGSFPVPRQFVREGIPPAALGIAAVALAIFLCGLLWWNPEKADRFQEDADIPLSTHSSDPLHDADPAHTFSPEENAPPAFDPELVLNPGHETESELKLMSIPSLPTNQQQGRHNRHDSPEATDAPPLSAYRPSTPGEAAEPHRFRNVE